jgi:predicted RNA-binding protein with PUA-like domain
MNWLVKEEPSNYSFASLQRDGRTLWSGVRNPLAQKHLKSMAKGDRVFFYHTGNEKSVVGTARVADQPAPDPADAAGKLWAVTIAPDALLPAPVTLAAIKADPFFADFALVRMGRLSVMPVTDAQWKRIVRMAGKPRT